MTTKADGRVPHGIHPRLGFDSSLPYSTWRHCGTTHIETELDGLVQNSAPTEVFPAFSLPARTLKEDDMGDS
jgi:hypothetical protein